MSDLVPLSRELVTRELKMPLLAGPQSAVREYTVGRGRGEHRAVLCTITVRPAFRPATVRVVKERPFTFTEMICWAVVVGTVLYFGVQVARHFIGVNPF